MKLSLYRLLGISAAVDAIAFACSGLLKHQKHGVGYVLGDIAWFGFLIGVLVVVGLAITAAIQASRRRSLVTR